LRSFWRRRRRDQNPVTSKPSSSTSCGRSGRARRSHLARVDDGALQADERVEHERGFRSHPHEDGERDRRWSQDQDARQGDQMHRHLCLLGW
jgi:hypothetical protein